jgi:ABC-2 type transport system ATP-binding protein
MTIFLTTHYMEEAEAVADKIAIIDHGKIIESGTVDEIKKRNGAETLEEAFLKLTGRDIRDDNPGHAKKKKSILSLIRRNNQ